MTFHEQLIITLVDKALIGAVVLLAGFGFNRMLERFKYALGLDATRRQVTLQSQITFKERQLGEFYGPIYALLKRIRPIDDLWNEQRRRSPVVDRPIVNVIKDSNNRIVDIILTKSNLIVGYGIPPSYTRFLTHVAIWHAFWDYPNADWTAYEELHVAHYDPAFETEIFQTTEDLKRELNDLYERYGMSVSTGT